MATTIVRPSATTDDGGTWSVRDAAYAWNNNLSDWDRLIIETVTTATVRYHTFAALGSSGYSSVDLKLSLACNAADGWGSGEVLYSTDGGSGWTSIKTYTALTSQEELTVSLPTSQNTANVQVKFILTNASANISALRVHELWIEAVKPETAFFLLF